MAFCQTWASTSSHIRHPWFDTTIMKRKHRETVSPDEEVETQSASHLPGPGAPVARPAVKAPPLKRRRYSNLENGFAQMSLGAVASVTPSLPVLMDADMPPVSTVPLAYTEPSIPEVKMKTSSWYEPEPDRIVITDMDSFANSDEEEDGNVTINPVLLDRIRSNAIETSTTGSTSTSQALVLFKPLLLGDKDRELTRLTEEREKEAVKSTGIVVDDDAMDVEP